MQPAIGALVEWIDINRLEEMLLTLVIFTILHALTLMEEKLDLEEFVLLEIIVLKVSLYLFEFIHWTGCGPLHGDVCGG